MKFKVVSAGNHSTMGDLFFSLPQESELSKAEERIRQLCQQKAFALYGSNPAVENRLHTELELMRITKTAYYFLILREIALLSQEHSAPVIPQGTLGASLLPYLLDITELNPMAYSLKEELSVGYDIPLEMQWTDAENPCQPDFSIFIAPSLRPLIHNRLDSTLSHIKDHTHLFCHISMVDNEKCEKAAKIGNSRPKTDSIQAVDFAATVRQYAAAISNTAKDSLFVTCDELFIALTHAGMPRSTAYDAIRNGVWAAKAHKQHYLALFRQHNISAQLQDCFENSRNLWPAAACAARVLLDLKLL